MHLAGAGDTKEAFSSTTCSGSSAAFSAAGTAPFFTELLLTELFRDAARPFPTTRRAGGFTARSTEGAQPTGGLVMAAGFAEAATGCCSCCNGVRRRSAGTTLCSTSLAAGLSRGAAGWRSEVWCSAPAGSMARCVLLGGLAVDEGGATSSAAGVAARSTGGTARIWLMASCAFTAAARVGRPFRAGTDGRPYIIRGTRALGLALKALRFAIPTSSFAIFRIHLNCNQFMQDDVHFLMECVCRNL